jgi:hypothetical protein
MPTFDLLDLVNAAMFVVIWLVQLVIYPSFALVPAPLLAPWHARYTRIISLFVVPLMLGQAVLLAPGVLRGEAAATAMLAMAAGAWIVTARFSVRLHGRIAAGDGAPAIAMLVRTNWPRTVLWTGVCVTGLLA